MTVYHNMGGLDHFKEGFTQMKLLRSSLVGLLAVTLAVSAMPKAVSANTELIPGSRLVFPYVDITAGRQFFLLITNASNTITAPTHLTFYGQNCVRNDQTMVLTPQDVNVVSVNTALGSAGALGAIPAPAGSKQTPNDGVGWVDVDVRDVANLRNSPSVRLNALMGEAVMIDTVKNFAFAYPAASSQGSSQAFTTTTAVISGNTRTVVATTGSTVGTIVTRATAGDFANAWFGLYETYPSQMLFPAFFAEDLCTASSPTLSAFIAIAGPADAFRKEAPGSELNSSTGAVTTLVNTSGDVFDGEEHTTSVSGFAHQLNGRLCNVYPTVKARTQYAASGGASYATLDSTLGAVNAVGWFNIDNTQATPVGPAPGSATLPNNPDFSTSNGFDSAARQRGMVGVLFEIEAGDLVAGTAVSTGDVLRNWQDPRQISVLNWPCFGNGTSTIGVAQTAKNCNSTGLTGNWIDSNTHANK